MKGDSKVFCTKDNEETTMKKRKKLRQGNKIKIVEFDRFLKDMNKQKSSTSKRETRKEKLSHYV